MQQKEIIEKLKAYFQKFDEVLCVYVFGSLASSKANPTSDINIAALLAPSFSKEKFFDFRLTRISELSSLLRREVDLVIFNEAPTVLAYQILKHGIRIYEKDDRADRSFEAKALMEYFDFLPYRKRCEDAMVKHLKESSEI